MIKKIIKILNSEIKLCEALISFGIAYYIVTSLPY